MKKVRMFKFSDDMGNEAIYFTDDFDADADDFTPPGFSIDFDEKLEIIWLPEEFPMKYLFNRE